MHGVLAHASSRRRDGKIAGFYFGGGALPSSLGFARALGTAASETVQTGTSTVQTTGLGANAPRFGRALDADPIGLVIEPTRTNSDPYSRDPGNASLGPGVSDSYTSGFIGPDGAPNATRVQVSSTGYAKYLTLASQTNSLTLSAWYAQGAGSGAFQIYESGTAARKALAGTALAAWTRQAITFAFSAEAPGMNPQVGLDQSAVGGAVAGARDSLVDLVQFEVGKWASESIFTSGATATRNGERLYHPSAALLASGGRLSMYLKAQFKHTPSTGDGAFRLWTDQSDPTTYVEISAVAGITISIGGVTNTTGSFSISWAAGAVMEIFVAAGGGLPSVFKYRANGGAITDRSSSLTGSALAAHTFAGALDLFCDASVAKQPGIRLYAVEFYRAGSAPAGW